MPWKTFIPIRSTILNYLTWTILSECAHKEIMSLLFVPASNVNKEGTRENAKQANRAVETCTSQDVNFTNILRAPFFCIRVIPSFSVLTVYVSILLAKGNWWISCIWNVMVKLSKYVYFTNQLAQSAKAHWFMPAKLPIIMFHQHMCWNLHQKCHK